MKLFLVIALVVGIGIHSQEGWLMVLKEDLFNKLIKFKPHVKFRKSYQLINNTLSELKSYCSEFKRSAK